MTFLEAFILAVVEGLTEYLPISSTGHLIITSSLMGIADDPFTKNFTVIVQFGAILSVLAIYWSRFITTPRFYVKLMMGVLPVLLIGFLVKDKVDSLLGDVRVVAWAMILGGIVLIFIDRVFAKQEERLQESNSGQIDQLSFNQAFLIGLVQCLALIPGVSRSAASIIGGLSFRLTRKAAAEFSFFLAVPTLAAATGYKLLKIYKTIQPEQISLLIFGNFVSFIVGIITIKAFIGFLTRRGFLVFGIYRLIVGAAILIMLAMGHSLQLI